MDILNRPKDLLLLIVLLLVAFGLRVYRLDAIDISGDEAWSITVAGWPLSDIVSSDAETNPPLYHLILHEALALWGGSPFAIRYSSVLTGLVAVAFITSLGMSVGGRSFRPVALATAAISPFLVYYAQDARMYGPALMGASGSLATFLLITKNQNAQRKSPFRLWLLYVLTSLIAVYSHYYSFALLIAQALFTIAILLVRSNPRRLISWFVAWISMGVLFSPWSLVHIRFLDGKASSRFDEWTLEKLGEIGRRTLSAYGAGTTVPADNAWIGWVVVLLGIIGLFTLWRQTSTRTHSLLLSFCVLIGIAFAWVVNPIMPFFFERYLLVGMPAFLILVVASLVATYRTWKPLSVLFAVALLAINGLSLRHQFFNPAFDKGGYGRLMSEIDQRSQPGDLMLLNNPLQDSLFDYYSTAKIPAKMIDRGLLLTDSGADSLLSDLTSGFQRIWLVETGNPQSYDPRHRAQRWLGERGSRGFYQNYGSGNILHLFILNAANEDSLIPTKALIADKIQLLAYSYSPEIAQAGETVLLSLQWQATTSIERGYSVFTHVVDINGLVVAQMDGQPVGGARPTDTWEIDELIIDNYAILLPDELSPGAYTVRVGMYLWPEMTRLDVIGSDRPIFDDSIELGTFELLPNYRNQD